MLTNHHKAKILLVFIALFSCFSLALCKLYFIQIKNTDFFTNKGQQQYQVRITATPERAPIYDRTGQALALNKDGISAFLIPNSLKEPEKTIPFLKKHFPESAQRLEQQIHRPFMYVKRQINKDEEQLIKTAHLADIRFLKEPGRFYPIESTGPLLGITDIDNQGKMGIELWCNPLLAGTKSSYLLKRDSSGHFYFEKETTIQGIPGKPVTLTIDGTLQFLAYQELQQTITEFGAAEGSVIIMNPKNGDIIVMANSPDFDPNNCETIDLEKTKNKIITESYEFGSVIKTFFTLAALEENIVEPDTIIDCENKKNIVIDGIRINTWKAHGLLTFSEVIEQSNNVGTTKVAVQLGTKLYDHYKNCGFSKKTNVQFPGEQKGYITDPATWSKQSLASLSYGYEIRATLLQLANAFCMIANDGIMVKPRLITTEPIVKETTPRYSAKTMQQLKEILTKTITHGTAHKAQIKGYTVLGKTGTANLLINGKYEPDHNIFTFAGIVQKGDYQRVIVTFIKESRKKDLYASSVAVPLFEHIAEKMLIHDKVI